MLFVWHAGCSMGERTARDDEKIRVSDAIQVWFAINEYEHAVVLKV